MTTLYTKSSFLLLALVLVVVPTTSYATFIVPQPPTLEAKSYVLMDAQSKKVLVEFNSREKLPPASLTKIMTSYVAAAEVDSGRLKVEEMVPISVTAWETPGSRMFIREGTTVSVSDLLRGIIIQSGNDASVAIAEYISGSEDEFAKLMNEYGEHLGLEDTIFKNSTGLPDVDHLSTAYDNALLARALILDYPEHYAMYAERDFTYNDIRQPNRNRLLALDETVDGVKTGYTEDAGYCLVASSMREGMRLISVVLGTDSNEVRIRETRKLFNYGFRNFEFRNLVGPETTFEVDVANGKEKTVEARLRTAVKHLVLRGDSSTKMTVQPVKDLKAPVDAGDVVGVLQVTVEGEEIATESLYAQADVEQIGFFQGIMQAIADFFSSKPKPEEPSATEEEEEES